MKPKKKALAALALTLAAACAPAPAVETPVPEAAPEAAFPATPPRLGPAPTLTLPTPVRRALPNGLEVVYVRHGSLPVVHATLVTPAGMMAEPATAPGLATLVADMLDEGAGGRDALELSAALDQLGASLSTGAGWDAGFVDLHVLRDRVPQALRLLADVVVRPDFPARELERLRAERITELTSAVDEPRAIAANAFARSVYGAAHPYGRLPDVRSTRGIDRAALVRFHQARYRPGGSTLVLVGDVAPDALHPVVEQAFAGWRAGDAPATPTPAPPELGPTRLVLVDKPGAEQSEIRIGHPGVARDSPDYFPLVVLNTILGGSFTSRLNTNLREQHGYAYGAGSSFSMRRGAGPFLASSSVFTAKTDSAVVEFFRELRRIREQSVPADELARAKNYVALGVPRRFETTEDVAGQIAELETYDLSLDFYRDFVQRVMEVTAQDVQRVANQYIRPDRAVVVVVGDRSQVEPGLRSLGLGPVEVRDVSEFVR